MSDLPATTARPTKLHPQDQQCLKMLLRVPEQEQLPQRVVEATLEIQRWNHILQRTGRLSTEMLILACIRAGMTPPDDPPPRRRSTSKEELPEDPETDLYEEPEDGPPPGKPLNSSHVLVGGRYYYVAQNGHWLEAAFVRKVEDDEFEFRPPGGDPIQVGFGEIREMD